jgi:hypothetical protein
MNNQKTAANSIDDEMELHFHLSTPFFPLTESLAIIPTNSTALETKLAPFVCPRPRPAKSSCD